MSNAYTPKPEHHFTFGLWTVGNPGRDPFGDPVRPPISPPEIVRKLGELGAYGVNLHDNDLIPRDATTAERDKIVREFKQTLKDSGVRVPMATTNLFGDPVFRDGAFTSNDARVRSYALQKTMRSMDLGVELGADTYVFWGGREGAETNAGKNVVEAMKWFRDALNFLCEYSISQGYKLKFAIEPKPNEPRGDIFLPTIGHMLAFIYTLDHPDMVGLNPEVAHDTIAGLDFSHGVAQAMEAGAHATSIIERSEAGSLRSGSRFGSEDRQGRCSSSSSCSRMRCGRVCGTSTATRIAPKINRACGISPRAACAPISSSRRRRRASTRTRRSRHCWQSSTRAVQSRASA